VNKNLEFISEENFLLIAAQNYKNTACVSIDEFREDLKYFNKLQKFLKKYYNNGELFEREILNLLIIIYNLFEASAATKLCFFKISKNYWPTLKTFLLFLSYLKENEYGDISVDLNATAILHKL
jgi:hypothetical protein